MIGRLTLTALHLTAQGARVGTREWHAIIATSAPSTPRVLWARPKDDLIIIRSLGLEGTFLTGLVEDRTDTTPDTGFPKGARVTVNLIGNPTTCHHRQTPDGGRIRGNRTGLDEPYWDKWLHRKLSPALTLTAIEHERMRGEHFRHGAKPATFLKVAFSAQGTVTDPTVLGQLIANGVGGGKAYGMGMLMVREVIDGTM